MRVGRQAVACERLGSPLYAELLRRVAADVEAGGVAWRVLEQFADSPPGSAFSLRFMGAVNRLVLGGEAPELEPHFRPGGDGARAWPAFFALLEERGTEITELALANPVQTNEVGRSAVLAPAILRLAGTRPLRLLELGASAGLNLRWDAYRYEDLWGHPDSPVQLRDRYEGEPPPFEPGSVEVVDRRGCDQLPLDPATDEGRLTLLSFIWPDQSERLELLYGALSVAADLLVVVDAEPAAPWLERRLAEPVEGEATVVFHSIVWQYLDEDTRTRIRAAFEEAGARATRDAPLAWLRMEEDGPLARVDATVWPGGESRLVARCGYHGRPVQWLG